jgi:hypothetical protein
MPSLRHDRKEAQETGLKLRKPEINLLPPGVGCESGRGIWN